MIGSEVKIGEGTQIFPGTVIEGKTIIGKNCKIGAFCHLSDMEIGDNVEIYYTVAKNSKIGDGSVIGPFAHIRPGTVLGKKTKIGNFVEVKNTTMGDNSKASHLSYLGDAVIGNDVNIGCGSITVNYDGKNKHITTIEDGVFVGCNVNLVAPITLGENSTIAAGSTLTKNTDAGDLAVARGNQKNIKGWIPPKNRK